MIVTRKYEDDKIKYQVQNTKIYIVQQGTFDEITNHKNKTYLSLV